MGYPHLLPLVALLVDLIQGEFLQVLHELKQISNHNLQHFLPLLPAGLEGSPSTPEGEIFAVLAYQSTLRLELKSR